MRLRNKILLAVAAVVLLGVYYYVTIPAINIHSTDTWFYIILIVVVIAAVYIWRKKFDGLDEMRHSKVVWGFGAVLAALVLAFVIGSVLSSPIVNANKYYKLMDVQKGEFSEDVEELSWDKVPILDKDTAALLGDRKMGGMVDMVSQYVVDDVWSQINYNETPVRVTPLKYADLIKWFTNMRDGIPAYIMINMADQTTDLVIMSEGMKYGTCEYFNRNIYRHLRFAHPTYIYGELSFEIDDDGVPYWIAPVKKFNIGLFGGETVGKVVLCNAITGETTTYDIEDCPQWVDRCYSADLLVDLFNYYGMYSHGFFNSLLSQRDCLQTTDGYNYLALDDDVWMYTGVTSVNGDQSNVGFVLSNQRTMETSYYTVAGATESSAMSSAEGQVQNLEYVATFPLLLNISGEPTYFVCLKDDAGLVKRYAMVNVQRYQIVAIGSTVSECEENYVDLMVSNGISEEAEDEREVTSVTGQITKIAPVVISGSTHYYIMVEGSDDIFDVSVAEFLDVIRCEVGTEVTMEYKEDENTMYVVSLSIEGEEVERNEDAIESENEDLTDELTGETEGTAEDAVIGETDDGSVTELDIGAASDAGTTQ